MRVNISAVYTNITRAPGLSGPQQFSGLSALLSTVDEAIAQVAAQIYDLEVVRKVQTESATIKRLLEARHFTKVDEIPEGKTWWEKQYPKQKRIK